MKTAAILVLALTIALVKSEDCNYKGYGWGNTVEGKHKYILPSALKKPSRETISMDLKST